MSKADTGIKGLNRRNVILEWGLVKMVSLGTNTFKSTKPYNSGTKRDYKWKSEPMCDQSIREKKF